MTNLHVDQITYIPVDKRRVNAWLFTQSSSTELFNTNRHWGKDGEGPRGHATKAVPPPNRLDPSKIAKKMLLFQALNSNLPPGTALIFQLRS